MGGYEFMKKRLVRVLLVSALALMALWPALAGAEGFVSLDPVMGIGAGGAESDAMLEAYIDRLSGLEKETDRSAANIGASLRGLEAAAYRALRPMVEEVADGQRTSTLFEVSLTDMGIPTAFTAGDLGVDALFDADGYFTSEAHDALSARLYPDISTVVSALLADCPYHMYWFDKAQAYGLGLKLNQIAVEGDRIIFDDNEMLVFSLPVSAEYSAGDFTFDTSVSATIQNAVSRAAAVVALHAGESDEARLNSYRAEICGMTDYNYPAAEDDDTPYGNPWQLIWVFDDDPGTTVVCEGYSKAFQYLCDMTSFDNDVTCVSVTGWMDGGAHMWNLVRMPNDKTYLADVTNCDDNSIGAPDLLFLAGYDSGSLEEGYVFRCGDDNTSYVYDDTTLGLFSGKQLEVSSVNYADDDQTVVLYGEAAIVASGVCGGEGENLTWTLDENGVLTISGVGAMADYASANDQPWSDRRRDIKSVVILDGVTSVGRYAFCSCRNMTDVVIPDSVTSVGFAAFYVCAGLEEVVIPDSVTSMGQSAFNGCSALTRAVISANMTRIEHTTFKDCASLSDVLIPEGVTYIGQEAFANCASLTEIDLPAGVTSLLDGAFSGCTGLTEVTIPAGLTGLNANVFSGCAGLTEVVIPDGVTSIKGGAFSGCTGLTSVTIPMNVTSIDDSAFSDCGEQLTIRCLQGSYADTWAQGKGIAVEYISEEGVVARGTCGNQNGGGNLVWTLNEEGLLTVSGAGGMTNTQAWTDYAGDILSVVVEEGATNIGQYAFDQCANLQSVDLPGSLTSVGSYAFRGCDSLTEVQIPGGVARIEANAFNSCAGLAAVFIPDSVTYIGANAFSGCAGLLAVSGMNGVTSIGSSAFSDCASLQEIVIPDSVTSLGGYAFNNCGSLQSVVIGGGVTSLSGGVFMNCASLEEIVIPDGVTSISANAFFECVALRRVSIPDSVTSIGGSAFRKCRGLTEITIPASVTSIADSAFNDTLATLVIRCHKGSFADGWALGTRPVAYLDDDLTTLDLPDTLVHIEDEAFAGTVAEVYQLPASVTFIGERAFAGLTGPVLVRLPAEGPVDIAESAFEDAAWVVIECPAGSPVETWAKEHGVPFVNP